MAQPAIAAPRAGCRAWQSRRNCSASPAQLGAWFACIGAVSVLIAAGFWWAGVPWVAPFAGLELLGVGVAFVCYARHAGDRESVGVNDGLVVVEVECGGVHERFECTRAALRMVPRRADAALVEFAAHGRTVALGRFVRPEHRTALAGELGRLVGWQGAQVSNH